MAYSPVGRGMLTGAISDTGTLAPDDYRRISPRFTGDNLAANLRLVDAVRAVAAELGVTPAQAALAWLLSRDDLVIPIPGTKRVRYLEENAAAVDVALGPDQLARIEAAAPPTAVAGARYPDRGMSLVGH